MRREVYLDNAATTCVDPRVLESMLPFFAEHYGNAASIHTLGQKARAAVERARRQVADLIGGSAQEILFTSGGTESDNLALRGAAQALADRGRHIITSQIEHSAVLKTCRNLENEGFRTTYLPVNRDGAVNVADFQAAIEADTVLVSIMQANNETGVIQPLKQIAELAKKAGAVVHTDAVQAAGKIPVDVVDLGVDLLTLSSHKVHGPKGLGALYVRAGLDIRPIVFGGTHQKGIRPGTENVPGIVGMGRACELALEHLEEFQATVRSLRDRLEEGVFASVPEAVGNGIRFERVPHISNISFRHLDGEALLVSLDIEGVAVSTGSACSSGNVNISHVLKALKLEPELAQGTIRFSLSRTNTVEDIEYTVEVIQSVVRRMRELSPTHG